MAKKHSPNFSKVSWDTERLWTTLANWPENVIINWSKVAWEYGITAKNGGRIVKEFTNENGFATTLFDNRKGGTKMHAKK